MYGKGISRVGELLDLAVDRDIIHKSGAWFSYGTERLGQGRDNIKNLLMNNKELADEIEQKVLETIAEENGKRLDKEKEKTVSGKESVIANNLSDDDDEIIIDSKDIDIMVEE